MHAEQPENRTAYAFWPTNEKPFATFLLDPNVSRFFDQISLRSDGNFFYIQMQSKQVFNFWLIVKTKNASNEEKRKSQENCSWPSRTGILQSSKSKAASSEEWMHDTMDWVKSHYFNRWKTFFSKIYFIHSTLIAILRYAGKKTEFRIVLEISCFWLETISTPCWRLWEKNNAFLSA